MLRGGPSIKSAPGRRAGSTGRHQGGRAAMAREAAEAGRGQADLHRRDLDRDEHDQALRPWAEVGHRLVDASARTGTGTRSTFVAGLRHGWLLVAPYVFNWSDQWRVVPRLCRAGSGSHANRWRHRGHGQSEVQPQGRRSPQGNRSRRRQVALPAILQSQSEPDRARLSPSSKPSCEPRHF